MARRFQDEYNEVQPEAKRPWGWEPKAASHDPTAEGNRAATAHTGGNMSTLTSEAAESSDDIITMTGVSIHRGDDDWPIGLLSTLRDTARKYVPDKVDKVFNVMPDWRFNEHDVLLPCMEAEMKNTPPRGMHSLDPAVASVFKISMQLSSFRFEHLCRLRSLGDDVII